MKILDFFRSRIILFLIQLAILSCIIYGLGYEYNIDFDVGISLERAIIIQFLANYVLFDNLSGVCFIYVSWIIISLIPIFVYNNFKKSYSMNLMTFFFLNFFLYVFLWRFSRGYFDANFQFHFLHTILLGILLVSFTIGLSIILKKITKDKEKPQTKDMPTLIATGKIKCPNCGTEFESIPRYCYNCNKDLLAKIE